ncbi:hypothetical protein OSTOST_22149, partial [Ostertagia ostertagi]
SSAAPCTYDNKFLRSVYWALRGCQYWLCFYDDEAEVDIEDLLSNPFNTQPPSLDHLQQLTGFDRRWLMFMYRNFKQKSSNGRMMLSEWRSVFRLLFPYAANYQFADRLYATISKINGHPHITFEDLIICLWELTEGARSSNYCQSQHPGVSVKAEFVFGLMAPDAKGRVNEAAFHEYVNSVFHLCGSKKDADDSATLGLPTANLQLPEPTKLLRWVICLPQESGVGVAAKFPLTLYTAAAAELRPLAPIIRKFAQERFRSLDADRDGFITVADIEREINAGRGMVLMSRRDMEHAAGNSPS